MQNFLKQCQRHSYRVERVKNPGEDTDGQCVCMGEIYMKMEGVENTVYSDEAQ